MDLDKLIEGHRLPEAEFTVDGETMHFQGLARIAYSALMDAHPPAPADREAKAQWNRMTFPAALLAACSKDGLTEDQTRKMWAEWDAGTLAQLFAVCYALNEDGIAVPFTVPGYVNRHVSGPNSNTAPQKVSPIRRSSVGRKTTKTKPSPGSPNKD